MSGSRKNLTLVTRLHKIAGSLLAAIGSVDNTVPTVISLYTTFEVLKSCPPLLFSSRNTVPLPLVTQEILDFSLGMKEC
jgi:hypothetical protein